MPNQKEGMLPARAEAGTPMSDERFKDLYASKRWNNNGSFSRNWLCRSSGSQWGYWEGRLAVGIMGIAFWWYAIRYEN